jgi:hypothetical protein
MVDRRGGTDEQEDGGDGQSKNARHAQNDRGARGSLIRHMVRRRASPT